MTKRVAFTAVVLLFVLAPQTTRPDFIAETIWAALPDRIAIGNLHGLFTGTITSLPGQITGWVLPGVQLQAQVPVVTGPLVTDGTETAQYTAKPPVLSDVDKLQIVNAAQEVEKARKDLEIAQLKVQVTTEALQKLVAAKTPAGFQLNEKLALVPIPAAPKEKAP